jgi:acyl-coenzyme A synthetase/AMP-(fatty) acid ligase/acyl carrier protein
MNQSELTTKQATSLPVEPLEFSTADLDTSVPARFQRVLHHLPPDHLACKDASSALTYQELDLATNWLASALAAKIGWADSGEPQKAVALFLPHSAASLVGTLGTLKSGHFYLPLDPLLGESMLRQILDDCPPHALVTTILLHDQLRHLLPAESNIPVLYLDGPPFPSAPCEHTPVIAPDAYVSLLYTSGSTGIPSGVLCTHAMYLYACFLAFHDLGYAPNDRIAHFHPYIHAISIRPLFGGMLNGATLYTHPLKEFTPLSLYEWLQQWQITQLLTSVGMLRGLGSLAGKHPILNSVRTVSTTGEAMNREDVEQFCRLLADGSKLDVRLASTEAGTYARLMIQVGTPWQGDRPPAGYAPPGVEVMIVDESGQPVAAGMEGEIAVCSRFLNASYWNRPEQTAAKFHPDPRGNNKRIFLTGDLGQMAPDGLVQYVGRKDNMVKIRGYRVELQAIEAALYALDTVQRAAVVAQPLQSGDKRLVAYVEPKQQPGPTTSELRRLLTSTLPAYMVPSLFIILPELPLTAGGVKVDRRALPLPGTQRPPLPTPFATPQTELEQRLCLLWAEILQLDEVGINDNFFDLGGDSISAARIVMRVQNEFQSNVAVPELLGQPTIAHMARLLSDQSPESTHQAPPNEAKATPSTLTTQKEQPPTSQRRSTLRRWAGYAILGHGPAVGPFVLPYAMGVKVQRAWLQLPFIRDGLLQRRSDFFRHCLEQMQIPDPNGDLLTLHLMATFWQLWRRKALAPAHISAKWVPVLGREHLVQAQQDEQRGVIILIPHTTVHTGILTRVIQQYFPRETCTIGYNYNRHSITQTPKEKSIELTGKLLRAIGVLQRHGVVRTTGDAFHGRAVLTAPFYGRLFPFRGGYAELAVQTGARVLPVFPYLNSDGHVVLDFAEPLEAGPGSTAVQVEQMVRQYADLLIARWPQLLPSMGSGTLQSILKLPGT